MPSTTNARPGFAPILLLTGVVTQLLGCTATPTSPTVGTSLVTDAIVVGARPVASITFVSDLADLQGSQAQLTSLDSSLLAFTTAKGSFTALFDNSTVFRNAQIDKFSPVDPCRQFAIDYNAGGISGDSGQLLASINSMANAGCLGRILTDKTIPTPPPIKSFRPLPTL
jgi:hypothetical protein